MRPRRCLTIALIAAAMAGCLREPAEPMRVGTNMWIGYGPLYLARGRGFLDPKIKLVEFPAASEAMRSLRNGAIDAACLTLDESLSLLEGEPDLAVALVFDVSHGADVVIARPGIASARDLPGKRIGVESTALGAYMLARLLEKTGIAAGAVTVVPVEIHEHEAAFRQGRIDAVITFEPVRTKILRTGAHVVFSSDEIPGEIVDVLVVRRDFLTRHGGRNVPTLRSLVESWYRAIAAVEADPAGSARDLGQRLELTPTEVLATLQLVRYAGRAENRRLLGDEQALVPVARSLSRVMHAEGLVAKPIPYQGIFDLQVWRSLNP
jgi:NitT/TauT family transport system substrate-binding protein